MKLKKTILILSCILIITLLTSCSKTTLINEVINRYVNYEQNISILDFEDALVEASEIAKESIVCVTYQTTSVIFPTKGWGSGVIIKKETVNDNTYKYYVITNRHVVLSSTGNERNIYISFQENDDYPATIEVYDDNYDIAILSFQCQRLLNVSTTSKEKTNVGRFVIAVGNPYDKDIYFNSVTIGNVSYVDRIIQQENIFGEKVQNLYIQHNAEINPGNSGGGLFNIKGELIGVNTWKISSEEVDGLNFAIPIEQIYNKYNDYFKD